MVDRGHSLGALDPVFDRLEGDAVGHRLSTRLIDHGLTQPSETDEHHGGHNQRGQSGHSSSSLARMRATDDTVWPYSTVITLTPVAARPCEEMFRTWVRMVDPPDVTATISSSIPAMKADTT